MRQLGANLRQISRVTHVYRVLQAGQVETGLTSLTTRTINLGQYGLDIGHGFAGLSHDISRVQACVANNAGRTGDEQHLVFPQTHQAGTRKRRAAWTIFLRIFVSTELAWIFNVQWGNAPGHKGNA